MSESDFERKLHASLPSLSPETCAQIHRFRGLVLGENEVQNLTRSLSEEDFIFSHTLDCVELQKSGFLSYPAMDLGSGMGVPGLLSSIIQPNPWILSESEKKKAEFLSRAANEMGLTNITVWPDRAEKFLKKQPVACVVARAVGPVGRIWGWVSKCSTWNSLILLKSRGWEREWKEFQVRFIKPPLKILGTHEYEAGPQRKYRNIVWLSRVESST